MSVKSIAANDPRLPAWTTDSNVLFTFSLCEACYDFPGVEDLVEVAIANLEQIV